jgi:antitoxin HicB
MNPNPMMGSSLDDLLTEQGLFEEVTAVAVKRILAWQLEQAMQARHLTKTDMAKQMHTSRAALNRLLDDQDTSLTLSTLAKAAKV